VLPLVSGPVKLIAFALAAAATPLTVLPKLRISRRDVARPVGV